MPDLRRDANQAECDRPCHAELVRALNDNQQFCAIAANFRANFDADFVVVEFGTGTADATLNIAIYPSQGR